jgi:hypothetical protein
MTNQSFDNQVKEKMSEHESPVPAGTWEAIANQKKKRRYPVFWWLTGAGILILGIAGGKMLLDKRNEKKPVVIVEQKVTTKTQQEKANAVAGSGNNTNPVNQEINDSIVLPVTGNTGTATSTINGKTVQPNSTLAGVSTTEPVQPSFTAQQRENNSIAVDLDPANKKKKTSKPVSENPGIARIEKLEGKPDINTDDGDISFIPGESKRVSKKVDAASLLTNKPAVLALHGNFLTTNLPTNDSALTNEVKRSAALLIRPKKPTWSIDVSVNPFMPAREKQSLTAINRTTVSPLHLAEFKADKIKTKLQPALSYSIILRKKFNKKIGLGVGLQYAVIKEDITLSGKETNTAYQIIQRLENGGTGPRLVDDTVANVTTGTRVINAINSYRYLDLPLSLQYMLIDRPYWSLQLNSGINISLYSKYNNSISGNLVAENASGIIAAKQGTTIQTGFFAGVRYSHYLTKHIQWFAQPYLRFNAGRYANTVINTRSVHEAGVGLGLSFNIGGK